jgi:hypothetical protein
VVGSTGLKPIPRKKRRSVAAEQLNYTKIVNHDAAETLVIGVEMIEIPHVLTGHFEGEMMIALAEMTCLLHQHREKAIVTRLTFSIVSCPS